MCSYYGSEYIIGHMGKQKLSGLNLAKFMDKRLALPLIIVDSDKKYPKKPI